MRTLAAVTTQLLSIVFLSVPPAPSRAATGYFPDPATDDGTRYTATKYPLVFVPGMFGFEKIAGFDYWYAIPQNLTRSGATVFTVDVAGVNSPEFRGEQVIEQVEEILAITGAEKVNLFGHSHGSPTIRYVAAVRPDLVASVTSISGVNAGVRATELMKIVPPGSVLEKIVAYFGNAAGNFLNKLSGATDQQDIVASLRSMTVEGMDKFNATYPQGVPAQFCGEGTEVADGIYYYSFSGANPATNKLDWTDLLFKATAAFNKKYNEPTDGLVAPCQSHLGLVIRDDYSMNHMDPMNWFLGLVDAKAINPVEIYRIQANRLQQNGL
jgi:triacylglycerol lipase